MSTQLTAAEALDRLMEGNRRFASGDGVRDLAQETLEVFSCRRVVDPLQDFGEKSGLVHAISKL